MKKPIITITIRVDSSEGERLDKYLSSHIEIKTRSRASYLINNGSVTVNDRSVKASYLVKSDDEISVIIEKTDDTHLSATPMRLDILFEDQDLIVINKPAGLVVHPAAGHSTDTLVNGLMAHTDDLSMKFGEDRPGIVHRLDKDTSGVLVVAKNDFAHEHLSKQFQERSVHRVYWAMVFGVPKLLSGDIKSYLARHPSDRKKFASIKNENSALFNQDFKEFIQRGKYAETHYDLIEFFKNRQYSLLQLKLKTGRTHQIRVHLSELGHPILGDNLYGAHKKLSGIKNQKIKDYVSSLNRFALHAAELAFVHPRAGNMLSFKVEFPMELTKLKELLNEN